MAFDRLISLGKIFQKTLYYAPQWLYVEGAHHKYYPDAQMKLS